MIRQSDFNVPGNIGEARPIGCTHAKVTHKSTKSKMVRHRLVSSWCGSSVLLNVVENREAIWILGAATPVSFPGREGKIGVNMNEWTII